MGATAAYIWKNLAGKDGELHDVTFVSSIYDKAKEEKPFQTLQVSGGHAVVGFTASYHIGAWKGNPDHTDGIQKSCPCKRNDKYQVRLATHNHRIRYVCFLIKFRTSNIKPPNVGVAESLFHF